MLSAFLTEEWFYSEFHMSAKPMQNLNQSMIDFNLIRYVIWISSYVIPFGENKYKQELKTMQRTLKELFELE